MTLKYESEILFDLMKRDGDDTPSYVLPYESELKEKYLEQVEGGYPKLQDYRSEWLNYNLEAHLPADFPVETLSNVTRATVDNVVPYAYGSAILKGQTLVNLIASDTIVGKSGGSATFINNKLRVNFPNYNWSGITIKNTGMFKPSTKYTIIAKATNTTSFKIEIGHNNTSFNAFAPINDSRMVLESGETGSIKVALITGDDLQIGSNVYNVLCAENPSSFSGNKFIDIELMIIEGNHTQEDIPYFVGMQSVKMPVLTTSNEDGTKSNILTVNEDVELRCVGDIRDELDLLTGELTQRIGEVVLDGSEDEVYIQSTSYFDSLSRYYIKINEIGVNTSQRTTTMICDKMQVTDYGNFANKEYKFVSMSTDGEAIHLMIPSDVSIQDFLQANPITVQYQLATESIKTVELSIQDQDGNTLRKIQPIEGTMHLMTEGDTIKPLFSGEIPVEATTQNLASFIKEE